MKVELTQAHYTAANHKQYHITSECVAVGTTAVLRCTKLWVTVRSLRLVIYRASSFSVRSCDDGEKRTALQLASWG